MIGEGEASAVLLRFEKKKPERYSQSIDLVLVISCTQSRRNGKEEEAGLKRVAIASIIALHRILYYAV